MGDGLAAGAAVSAAFIAAHSALPTRGAGAVALLGGDVRSVPLAALPPRSDCDPCGCGLVGVLAEGDESDDEDMRERLCGSGAARAERPGPVEIVFARPRARPPPRPRLLNGPELGMLDSVWTLASRGRPFGAFEVGAPATAVIAVGPASDRAADRERAHQKPGGVDTRADKSRGRDLFRS